MAIHTIRFGFEGHAGQPYAVTPGAPILTDLPSLAFRGFNVALTSSVGIEAPHVLTHTTEGRKGEACMLPVSGAPDAAGLLPWQIAVLYRRGDADTTIVVPTRAELAPGAPLALDLGTPLAGEHLLEVSVGVVLDRAGESVAAPKAVRDHWRRQADALNAIGSNAALELSPSLRPVRSLGEDGAALGLLRARRHLACWPVIPFDTGTLRTTRNIVIDPVPRHVAWIRVAMLRDLSAWLDAVKRHAEQISAVEESDPVAVAVSAAEARALFVERYWAP